jgi:hypothetical protein
VLWKLDRSISGLELEGVGCEVCAGGQKGIQTESRGG